MKGLYKTTIVIWSEYDPMAQEGVEDSGMELSDLAREAEIGDAYCSFMNAELIARPELDDYPPSEDFFLLGLNQDDDEVSLGPVEAEGR